MVIMFSCQTNVWPGKSFVLSLAVVHAWHLWRTLKTITMHDILLRAQCAQECTQHHGCSAYMYLKYMILSSKQKLHAVMPWYILWFPFKSHVSLLLILFSIAFWNNTHHACNFSINSNQALIIINSVLLLSSSFLIMSYTWSISCLMIFVPFFLPFSG